MSLFFVRHNFFPSVFFIALLVMSCAGAGFAQDEQPNSIKIFNQAQDVQEKGDYQTALKLYDEALKITPEFPEAEYQRGAIFLELEKFDEAEKAFRRSIELREDWTLPMGNLGSILVLTKRFAEAEKVLTKVIELDEENFPAYVALTKLRLQTKTSPDVLKDLLAKLQNLTSKAKPTASAWAARGAVERALDDKVSAEKSLDNALSIEPNNSFALSERAEFFISKKDFARAIDDLKMLVKILPNSASAKILLARAFAQSGNPSEALKILDGLDSLNADVAELKNSIAGNETQDISALEQQLETNKENAAVLSRLCNLTHISNPQKALDYCGRASALEPNNINHAISFGAALVQAKQFENAVALFRRLLPIAPDNFTARANLAVALFQLKHYSEAKTEYQWLIKKKPDLAIAYYFLAITHDQMGEYRDALENYQMFLRLADAKQNQLEMDKVNLRLPSLRELIKRKGK